jgi:hypothetical protein
VWTTLLDVGIARKTRRGCRAGRLKKRPIEVHITPKLAKKSIDDGKSPAEQRYLVRLPAAQTRVGKQSANNNNSLPKACLATWNARSIKYKNTFVADLIISEKIDILAITETWLCGDERDEVPLADIKNTLPHFAVYHIPRPQNKTGGGVCLLSHKGFSVKLNETRYFQSFEYLDALILVAAT